MTARLSPIGFWSYARQDDDASGGKLSLLRFQLASELQQQYGREPIKIFQDVGSIPPGAEWEAKIRTAMHDSSFLIPIITPNFLQSRWCNHELTFFLEREAHLREAHPQLKGQRFIFPVHYVDTAGVDPENPEVLRELRKLQWFDFRSYRLKDYTQEAVCERLAILAKSLRDLLQTRLDQPEKKVWQGATTDDDRKPAPPAPPPPPAPPQPVPPVPPPSPPPPKPAPTPPQMNWVALAPLALLALVIALIVFSQRPKPASPPANNLTDTANANATTESNTVALTSVAPPPAPGVGDTSASSSSAETSNRVFDFDNLVASVRASSSSSNSSAPSPPAASTPSTSSLLNLGPSFDCTGASNYADRTICSDSILAGQDRRYAALYRVALLNDTSGRIKAIGKLQLAERNACTTWMCLSGWYSRRIGELSP